MSKWSVPETRQLVGDCPVGGGVERRRICGAIAGENAGGCATARTDAAMTGGMMARSSSHRFISHPSSQSMNALQPLVHVAVNVPVLVRRRPLLAEYSSRDKLSVTGAETPPRA